jgi:hypothetical protein
MVLNCCAVTVGARMVIAATANTSEFGLSPEGHRQMASVTALQDGEAKAP